MIETLTKLDPDLVVTLIAFAGTVGRWLLAKVKGEQTASLKDKLWPVIEGTVLKLAANEFIGKLPGVTDGRWPAASSPCLGYPVGAPRPSHDDQVRGS